MAVNTDPKPVTVIAQGRSVMRAIPSLQSAAAEILHDLDTLDEQERVKARRYLLHVYGIAVGCHPNTRRLEEAETWAQDRNALAAASGHLHALSSILEDGVRDEHPHDAQLVDLTHHHADALLEVAHRG